MTNELRSSVFPATNNLPAHWIKLRLDEFATSVVSYVPNGFEAYARIFHPASLSREGIEKQVSWLEVAKTRGIRFNRQTQWTEISGDDEWGNSESEMPDVWTQAPDTGTLTPILVNVLSRELRGHTKTPECCWFAVWGGYGYLSSVAQSATKFTLPERELHLLRGTVEAVDITFASPSWIYQSANLWWPDDQTWCIASPVDLMSTYVGASADAIAALLRSSELEIVEVSPSDKISL